MKKQEKMDMLRRLKERRKYLENFIERHLGEDYGLEMLVMAKRELVEVKRYIKALEEEVYGK